MILHLDSKACTDKDFPISSVLMLATLYFNSPITDDDFRNLCRKGYIEYDGFDSKRKPVNLRITKDGTSAMETMFLNSEFPKAKDGKDRFTVLATTLREIYPKGKKDGTAYMWRDSVNTISKRLKAFIKKYGDFSDDQIISATKKYVEGFNGNYQFMQLLKYFISKQIAVNGTLEEKSELLSYMENPEDSDSDGNWLNVMR